MIVGVRSGSSSSPFLMPKGLVQNFSEGGRQLVVHEAFEMDVVLGGS